MDDRNAAAAAVQVAATTDSNRCKVVIGSQSTDDCNVVGMRQPCRRFDRRLADGQVSGPIPVAGDRQ